MHTSYNGAGDAVKEAIYFLRFSEDLLERPLLLSSKLVSNRRLALAAPGVI
jgi:hypothetical protein